MTRRSAAAKPLFENAEDVIRLNIENGTLAPGVVLLESALAEVLKMSRAPVKRALSQLEQQRLISRFDGRGYMVGAAPTPGHVPKRIDIRRLGLDLGPAEGEASGPNWTRIHDEVEAELSRCLVFGQFRIIEDRLAEHYDVSRTVARDVLGRLQERRIVAKNATSRWILKPLTAQIIRERFELRAVLEVAALRTAAPHLDREALRELARRIESIERADEDIDQAEWFEIMGRFIDLAVLTTPNSELADYVASNRKTLQASHSALFRLGMPSDRSSVIELRIIVELLLNDASPSAATMFEQHISKLRDRTIAQLKIVAVVPAPTDLPPYVVHL